MKRGASEDMATKKTKNKDFLKWTRAESCFRKDNIVSTDWHERLEKMPMFEPTYAKCRPDMYQIMSMEYGRMWHKEKDDWFAGIFKPDHKEQNIKERQKRLRREFLEAKRKADIKIKERKERVAKEKEAKAKADAEAQEKARRAKVKLEKRPIKKKDKKEIKSEIASTRTKTKPNSDNKNDDCPKGWTQVELTVQCECEGNKSRKDGGKGEERADSKAEGPEKVSNDAEEEGLKREETEGSEKREVSCDEKCMPAQIAEALEKSLEKDTGNGDDPQEA